MVNGFFLASALCVYSLLGLVLIAQKPGLQYDEALLVSDAVHMEHSRTVFKLDDTPKAWVCPFHHCVPLMAFSYVGAIKEYANLGVFEIFGPHASLIRLVALFFGGFVIWGIYGLLFPWFGRKAAAVFAFALAVNPAFLNMVVFDNGANGGFMAGLGLTCFCVSLYGTRRTTLTAFWLGAAIGFAIWSRANFLWVAVAGAAAAVLAFRRQAWIGRTHALAIALGGCVGGAPFLLYQIVSRGATWRAQRQFTAFQPIALRLRERLFFFADTLISDGEHRQMWQGPPLPPWQLWLFPSVVFLACLVCLVGSGREENEKRRFARFLTLTFLFTGGFLFFSRLPVAEHHLIALVPLALALVVVAGAILQARWPRAWVLCAILGLVYGGTCFYWQIQTARGLRSTGGIAVWSNRGPELANYLEENFDGREIRILDWGLLYNLYVLTDGRIEAKEVYSKTSENYSRDRLTWTEEIRNGGVFLLHGPENREFPQSSVGFLRALNTARPVITQTRRILQKDGATYAQVIEIAPDSFRSAGSRDLNEVQDVRIPMNTSRVDGQLTGFYEPDVGGFRWTKRGFSARLDLSHLAHPIAGDLGLRVSFYLPESAVQKLHSLTLTMRFNGHALEPGTLSRAGQFVLRRALENSWIVPGTVQVDFSLDKVMPPSENDQRELGVAMTEIAVEPE